VWKSFEREKALGGKLRLLDLALVALAALLYWQLRHEWIDAHARDLALLHSALPAARVPGLAPLDKVDALTAAEFADVATQNLFSQDRNGNVIVDPPKPPPPKPQPPFPVAHGVMLWDGVPPTIVLSEKANGPQKGYHPGDTIGPWTIVSVDSSYADFEWDGKEFKKRIDELIDRAPIAEVSAPPGASAQAAPAKTGAQTLSSASHGPGVDVGNGRRGCLADDDSPEGTVVDGMKKVVSATLFGKACRWEPNK
jgi:hypothetical protein